VVVQRKAQQNFGVGVNRYPWVGREEFAEHDAAEGGEEAEVYGNEVSPVLIGSFCVPSSQLVTIQSRWNSPIREKSNVSIVFRDRRFEGDIVDE
jgi:hypothetical protein